MKRVAKSIGFVLVACALMGCSDLNKKVGLPDDNYIEEAAEAILESQTNIDLDFTPVTPE